MKLPRRQNPHMHLLEALLALHVATGEKNWLRRAGAMVDLFKRRFADPQTGALIEFFADDWSPAPGDAGRLREPGHQFEWVWLLHEYYRAQPRRQRDPLRGRLFAFGDKFGIERGEDLPGAVFDGVDAAGHAGRRHETVLAADRIHQGAASRAPNGRMTRRRAAAIAAHLALIAQHYMRPDGASWHNQLARDGKPLTKTTPARVLYHLFLAVARWIGCRLRDRQAANSASQPRNAF